MAIGTESVDSTLTALPLSLSVRAASRVLGVAKSTLYKACKNGQIRSFTVGGAVRIPRVELERLLGEADGGAE